jgi:hypothetical protein
VSAGAVVRRACVCVCGSGSGSWRAWMVMISRGMAAALARRAVAAAAARRRRRQPRRGAMCVFRCARGRGGSVLRLRLCCLLLPPPAGARGAAPGCPLPAVTHALRTGVRRDCRAPPVKADPQLELKRIQFRSRARSKNSPPFRPSLLLLLLLLARAQRARGGEQSSAGAGGDAAGDARPAWRSARGRARCRAHTSGVMASTRARAAADAVHAEGRVTRSQAAQLAGPAGKRGSAEEEAAKARKRPFACTSLLVFGLLAGCPRAAGAHLAAACSPPAGHAPSARGAAARGGGAARACAARSTHVRRRPVSHTTAVSGAPLLRRRCAAAAAAAPRARRSERLCAISPTAAPRRCGCTAREPRCVRRPPRPRFV